MDTDGSLTHPEGTSQVSDGTQQTWQVTIDSPQRYPTPSGVEDPESTQAYTSIPSSVSSTLPSLSSMQLPDNQNYHTGTTIQPLFTVSSAGYESRVEDFAGLINTGLQNMALPTSTSMTLQHMQQVLQQATDRKNLPPHLQVVPLFDSGIGLSALQRSTTLNQSSLNTGLGSIGLGINALNNGQISSNAVTVTSSLPITSLSSATIDTRDQIISDNREQLVSSVQAMHASLLAEQSQNNSTNLQNPPLFSMVQLAGGFHTGEGTTDAGSLMITDPDSEHNMHLTLSDVAKKQIADSFNTGETEGSSTTNSPSFSHLQPSRHYTDGSEAYQPQNVSGPLTMTPSLSERIDNTLHQTQTQDGASINAMVNAVSAAVNGTLSSDRLLAGSHDTTADLSAANIITPNNSTLHIIEPQGMLGLNEAPLHDPMVTQHESSDEDDNDDSNAQNGQVPVYDNTDSALFMPRKSQRIAERERSPSPTQPPFYLPKEYYSISEIWCEDCQTSYSTECIKHKQQPMYDKVLLSRAWATLPSPLQIFRLGDTSELGVFARKTIRKRTKFGPFYAPLVESPDHVTNKRFMLKIENEDGSQYFIEASDENTCNWMMFVRPANNYTEQNLVAFQYKMDIFYVTTKNIEPKQELKVWYAAPYASRMGVEPHRPTEEELQALDVHNKWPCYECDKSFRSSALLQKHLSVHEDPTVAGTPEEDDGNNDEETNIRKGRRKSGARGRAGKGKAKKIKELVSDESTVFQSWKKRKTNMYLNKIRKYREPIKRSLMTLYKKQGKDSGGNEWVCTNCDLTFDNPSLLNLHTLTHAAEDLAMVDLNSTLAPSVVPGVNSNQAVEMLLTNSVAGISGDTVIQWDENHLQCPVCDKMFDTKQELILHASEHARKAHRSLRIHPRKPFKCMTCWKSFSTDERLQKHMLCHSDKVHKPFKCDKCNKRFMNSSALACHVKTHSDKKYYECLICNRDFDQIHAMKEHVQEHTVNGMYDCPECHKSFPDYKMVRRHIKFFHSPKRYSCTECEKVFSRADKLKLHMLKHSNHREFMCESCGRQFKRKDKLGEHKKRMHNPLREKKKEQMQASQSKKFSPKVEPNDYNRFIYKCHICMLGFKRRGMLVNHIAKRHPNMKPNDIPELNLPILRTNRDYFCQYCDKVYKSSSKRKMHILKYHPGGQLPPSIRTKNVGDADGTNASFSQPAGSITTMPHPCSMCHKQYASKAKLLQHQRKKHPDADSALADRRRVQIHVQATTNNELTLNTSLMEKPRLLAAIIQKPLDNTAAEVITIAPQTLQSIDSLQGADLLTQAMSELNPALTEFRTQGQASGATIEYQLAGVVPAAGGTATLVQPATALQPQQMIELSHLGQLSEAQVSRNQSTQVMHVANAATSVSTQVINPISVVTSTQALNAIPVTLAGTYLQKAAPGINWATPQTVTQPYR